MDNETVFSYSQDEIDEIRQKAVEKAKTAAHTWRQRGAFVYCKTCENEHGIYIGTNKILVGEKDGQPRIVDKS